MSSLSASRTTTASMNAGADRSADGTKLPSTGGTGQPEVNVRNCNRLGRTANPPRLSIANLFRFGRRR